VTTVRNGPGPLRRLAALAAAGMVAALVLGGCTSARNTLGTNASPCFLSLPIAADAVHEQGALQGVLLVEATSLARSPRLRALLTARAGAPVGTVCAFSYRGSYSPAEVEKPIGTTPPGTGPWPYAVVVVSMPENVLLGTFVLEQEPMRFRHNV